MLSKKVPLYFSVISMFIGAALVYIIFISFYKNSKQLRASVPSSVIEQSTACDFNIVRLQGYHFVKPLLYNEQGCESSIYTPLKTEIGNLVADLKNKGDVNIVSVYLRVFKQGTWMCYNPEATFKPGSLLKIPVLLTFLKMTEDNPSLMNKEILFEHHNEKLPKQMITTKTLTPGHKYSMKELIKYMIEYSDNDATALLESQINNKAFQQTFTDLGLISQTKDEKGAYLIGAKDYSIFLKVLYNASYLTIKDSEYATSLLAKSDFKDALAKGIPDKTELAHKFGESGNLKEHQLHDAGIVYINDMPYILTIMTKGSDLKKLSDAISKISKLVYDNLTENKN